VNRLSRMAVNTLRHPILCTIPLMMLVLGCAQNRIFEQFNVDAGESLSVDAKQRMILVTRHGGKSRDRLVVCAEPSPDAVSAVAASMSTNANVTTGDGTTVPQGNASLEVSAASSEVVATLAMRTQTVQLLRDGLFRACEAYMNGAIDQHQYNVILLNINRLMVTLMGVDAIGGGSTVPNANVTAQSSGTPSASGGKTSAGDGARHAQSEAVADIVFAANNHSSIPALCISLLASGELRFDNPGQRAILERCDYLIKGTVRKLIQQPLRPRPKSRLRQRARAVITHKLASEAAWQTTTAKVTARSEQPPETKKNSSAWLAKVALHRPK